jgi:hypothetical protein
MLDLEGKIRRATGSNLALRSSCQFDDLGNAQVVSDSLATAIACWAASSYEVSLPPSHDDFVRAVDMTVPLLSITHTDRAVKQ